MKRTAVILTCATLLGGRVFAQDCSPTQFITGATYPSAPYTYALAVGDFTNDGEIDVLVMSQSGVIEVFPGLGDGKLGASILTDKDYYYPFHVVAGFFDSNSNLDLAVSYYDNVGVYLGNGDGTFQDPTFYATTSQTSGLVTADLNGDSRPDLAAFTGGDPGQIFVFLGNPDGSFNAQAPIQSGIVVALAAGSIDPGNTVDLAAVSGIGVKVFPGLGNGAFGPPSSLKLGGALRSVALADLDDDGFLDVAVGIDVYAAVFHNNGDGTFLAAVEHPLNFPASELSAADVNGDGLTDLVGLYGQQFSSEVGVVSVLVQQPNGGLGIAANYGAGVGSQQLAVADLDGDGTDDVVVSNYGDFTVSVLLGSGDGSLRAIRKTQIPPIGAIEFAAGDFDEDGLTDFVALDYNNGGHVTFLRSDGEGHLELGQQTASLGFSNPQSILAADLTGDGRLDVAVPDYFGQVAILMGMGDGSFTLLPPVLTNGFSQRNLVTGDFNGDAIPDLGVFDDNSPPLVEILFGLGGGAFVSAGSTALEHYPGNLLAVDLNGDTYADLVGSNGACCNATPTVSVLLSNGDGTFQAGVDYPTVSTPNWVASADFNEDDVPDLVTANNNANISFLLGNGAGGFSPPLLIAVGWPTLMLQTGDFDADTHADIVAITSYQYNRAILLRGVGNGFFQLPESYVVGSSPYRVFSGDFDAGSALDAAILGSDQTFSMLLNADLTARVANGSAIVGSAAVLSGSAAGFGPVTYQWRRDGVPLSDGGPISGSTTATLTIDPAAFTDAGSYDVVVTDSCRSATSNAAILAVEFDDVPLSNPFHDDILTIATAGITGGCNTGTSYCPANPVSRAEMAVLLLKAKFGADHVPPPPPPVPTFPDVPANAFAAAWIEELASLGVTAGCGNGNYCPDASVTRAEMAVFLIKTLLGSGYVPPDPAGIFSDVAPDNFAIAFIEDLYNRGITAGCGTIPLRYCPDTAVPREQMATFLVRTFLGP